VPRLSLAGSARSGQGGSQARLGQSPRPDGAAGGTFSRSPRGLRDDRADIVLGW
jgi:hypothetical protein